MNHDTGPSAWKLRALEAESALALQAESYDHTARNYRQLRGDINRAVAIYEAMVPLAPTEELRTAYERFVDVLVTALNRPLE